MTAVRIIIMHCFPIMINDSELFAGSMSYQDYCRVRGVYIGDMFYLVTEKGIVSYNIQKDYEQTGTLKWEA